MTVVKKWYKLVIFLVLVFLLMLYTQDVQKCTDKHHNMISDLTEEVTKLEESTAELKETAIYHDHIIDGMAKELLQTNNEWKTYRLTSFAPDDGSSTDCTGTGLCTWDFQKDEHNWFTYKGMIVLAGATERCLNINNGSGKGCDKYNKRYKDTTYFDYYDVVQVIIDNQEYTGVILDSCGACMGANGDRLDVFVEAYERDKTDRGYKGVNPILVKE